MKALEFITTIRNNTITIPETLQEELKASKEKTVRVIVIVEEAYSPEDKDYRNMIREEFLAGYDGTDSIYDNP